HRLLAATRLGLSPDHRAEYAVPPPSAQASGRRRVSRHATGHRDTTCRSRVPALRNIGVRKIRAASSPQSQLLDLWRLSRYWCGRAWQVVVCRPDTASDALQTTARVQIGRA